MKAFLVYMYKTFIILQNRNESVWVYRVELSLQVKYFHCEFYLM